MDESEREVKLSEKLVSNDRDLFKDMKNKFIQSNSEQMYLGPNDDARVVSLLAKVDSDSVADADLSLLDQAFAKAKDYLFV